MRASGRFSSVGSSWSAWTSAPESSREPDGVDSEAQSLSRLFRLAPTQGRSLEAFGGWASTQNPAIGEGEPGYGNCRPMESRDEAAPSHRTWKTPPAPRPRFPQFPQPLLFSDRERGERPGEKAPPSALSSTRLLHAFCKGRTRSILSRRVPVAAESRVPSAESLRVRAPS